MFLETRAEFARDSADQRDALPGLYAELSDQRLGVSNFFLPLLSLGPETERDQAVFRSNVQFSILYPNLADRRKRNLEPSAFTAKDNLRGFEKRPARGGLTTLHDRAVDFVPHGPSC